MCGVCDAMAVGAAPPAAKGAAVEAADAGGRPHFVLLVLRDDGDVKLGSAIELKIAVSIEVSMTRLVGVVCAAAGAGVDVTISFL